MADHLYTNTASVAQLNAAINPSDTTVVLTGGTFSGFPAAPFWGILDRSTATAELVEVTNVASNTLTVVRAQGGTSAQSHGGGAVFEHVAPAIVFQNSEAHISASTGVHGVGGSVVGTMGSQTVQDKTFRGAHRAVFSDALPAGVTASFESTADSAAARDGFVHNNTAADVDRRGFLLAQSGTPRFEVFNDGTVKNAPAGGATRKGIETTTSLKAGTTLEVGGASTLSGTLGVTGATSLSTVSTSGAATLNSAAVTNNATVGGTLGITGTTTAAAVNATSLTASAAVSGLTVGATNQATSYGGRLIPSVTNTASVTNPVLDQVIYDISTKTFKRYNGTAWKSISIGGTFKSNSAQALASGANKIQFPTTVVNDGISVITNDGFFVPEDGVYAMTFSARLPSGGDFYIGIGGTSYSDSDNYTQQHTAVTSADTSITTFLTASTVVCCYVYVVLGATNLNHAVRPARFDISKVG